MDYAWIIQINSLNLVTLGIILYSVCKNYDRQIRQRYFINALVIAMISFSADINWGLIEGKFINEPRIANFLTNSTYLISTIILSYCWFCYVEYALGASFMNNKLVRKIITIPVIIIVIGVILSYFNGFFFYIDENNIYRRGNFIILHTAFCHIYTIFTTIHAVIRSVKCKIYLKAIEYRILAMFLFFPFGIGIIQILLPNIPTVSSGITLSFLYIYIDLQNLLISVDTLSGLNNRTQLLRYLGARLKSNPLEGKLYVFMLDVNKFKKINDTYGHVEGDNALIHCSNALKKANKDSNNFIGRYGGDEFIIIADLQSDFDADLICEKIRNELAKICKEEKIPYDLSLSFGYAYYKKEMHTMQSFIAAADEKLYEAKKARDLAVKHS
ncbi:GGDEF domain-containing protein [Treponema sp. C6A8]|uniref:GGDEF domain-containing protein n=1 Tax=Treponema sp. C6A8 TaxID=1410609 RepID=UPI0004898123|nr:GGDEF domain-containing protein [Treponema sp. C6A8]